MWDKMGRKRNTAWQNTCGALPVQFQQCHPCEWQDWDGFQAKQNYRNVKATIRFSQIIPNTNLHHLEKTGRYLQLPSFTSFALHDLYSCSCAKVVILTQLTFAVEMWAQTGQITNTAWQNTCAMLPVQLHQWHPCEWQD